MSRRRARSTRRRGAGWAGRLSVIVTIAWGGGVSARAQADLASSSADSPWDRGVTVEARETARALFRDGARLMNDFQLPPAIDRFREALTHWQHPAIYYNLGRALYAQDRPLDAYEAISEALRHGPAPLGEDPDTARANYQKMLELRSRLRRRLAEISVAALSPGAVVDIGRDARAVSGDGRYVVMPGPRLVSAKQSGHRDLVQSVKLHAGRMQAYQLTSYRRFTPWKPWAIAGTGVVLGLAGGALLWRSDARRDDLSANIRRACNEPEGCDPQSDKALDFADGWSSIQRQHRIGLGAAIVGGVAFAVGAVLVINNWQPRLRVTLIDEAWLLVAPTSSPSSAEISARITF